MRYFAEAEHRQAAKRLVAVNGMVNQAVGDALSAILMAEVVLHIRVGQLSNGTPCTKIFQTDNLWFEIHYMFVG